MDRQPSCPKNLGAGPEREEGRGGAGGAEPWRKRGPPQVHNFCRASFQGQERSGPGHSKDPYGRDLVGGRSLE